VNVITLSSYYKPIEAVKNNSDEERTLNINFFFVTLLHYFYSYRFLVKLINTKR
jgi:hypothetical protein